MVGPYSPPLPDSTVGSLSRQVGAWVELPASDWAVSIIRVGFRLPWKAHKAPLSLSPVSFPPPKDRSAFAAIEAEVASLVRKGAVVKVDDASPGFYGRIFVVAKSTGGWRPVLDLSTLNTFLTDLSFRMETAASVRESIHREDWAVSMDLKDAYFHILIHPADRKFLRFVWNKVVFQFVALPFGLAPAPWVFTKITREFCRVVRGRGIRLRVYLDDWLLLAASAEQCSHQCRQVLDLCSSLGFVVNWDKSDLVPSQRFTYLGMALDTVAWLASPSPQRLERLRRLIASLRSGRSASARQLTSLLGVLESLALLLPLGRLYKRPLQRWVRQRWTQGVMPWSHRLSLDQSFWDTLAQWSDQRWLSLGVPIVPPAPEEELFSDASNQGWGAHVSSLTAAGVWEPAFRTAHINLLELEAVFRALKAFISFLEGKRVLINTDNTTVACYLNRQGGARSRTLSQRAEQLLLWAQGFNLSIQARFVPGRFNVLADALSRSHMVLPSEWTLAHNVLEPVWDAWHKPMVDLFATRFSRRLPLYVSPVPDPDAWAVDALSIDWQHLSGYAFPPFPVLGKVLRKARVDAAHLIIIAPFWPAQAWFPDLLALSHVPPLKLRVSPSSLVQPRSGVPHGNPGLLNLHAWLLCGKLCPHKVPPRRS